MLAIAAVDAAAEDRAALLPESPPLPRVAATAPVDAIDAFRPAAGFRIELVAAEPLVVDPVAMAFDEQGRLFVAEMRGYSERDGARLGRVKLLHDDDGDGRFDRSTVYADDLAWPTAVACYDGGVYVGAAPDILYFKDLDGDGRSDHRETVLTGFAKHNVQGLLNSFRWGLDNRIHVAASSCGGAIYPPGQQQHAVELQGRDLAFDPQTGSLEPTTGGGQFGMSLDRWGRRFVCSNSDHAQMILAEDRYLQRNPYQAGPDARRSIAVDGPQAAVYRTSPVEPWRVIRTKWRVAGLAPGPIEGGGTASGYFTSASGVTIYEGDAWPEQYRGWLIVADVGSNLVHRKQLVTSGVGYEARRVDQQREFLTSTDNWFRPVQFRNGPDGALYIADMYREVVEHPDSLPPQLKRRLDLNSGNDRGRIYRVVHEDVPPRRPIAMGGWTLQQLAKLLEHPNAWHRRTAARLIYERRDRAIAPLLRQLVTEGETPEGRLSALAALQGLGAVARADLQQALGDPHPQVRRFAIETTDRNAHMFSEPPKSMLKLADDPAPVVRQQLAFSLGNWRHPAAADALARLIRDNAGDQDVLGAALTSMVEHAQHVVDVLANDREFVASTQGREIIESLRRQLRHQAEPRDAPTAAVEPSGGESLATVSDSEFAQREQVYQRFRPVLELAGDAERGRTIFGQQCAACHRLENVGHEIGPNLASMTNRGMESVLYNILVPNRAIDPKFQVHHVTLRDGRTISGLIVQQTSTSMRVFTAAAETETILRVNVDQLVNTGVSFMPSGFENQLDRQAMADLLAYLASVR